MKKTLLTICLTWMCFSLSAQKIIDLSGKWSFSIDRQDNGEKEKWFSHTLNDFINLPGSMPEKLKGDEVTAKTQWTGSLYDSSYYYNPYMEKYRKEGNIKFPFFDALVFNKNLTNVKIINKKKSKELTTESNGTTEDNLNYLQVYE